MSEQSIQSNIIRYSKISDSIIINNTNNLEYNEFNSNNYPWKLNTTYILHDNSSVNIPDYSFNITNENYLLIESKTSDIKFKTIDTKEIIFDASVNFNSLVGLSKINSTNINNSNNIITSYINSTNARFNNIQIDGELSLTNQQTTNIRGTINLEGQIFINGSTDIMDNIGISSTIINNATINNTVIGLDISNNAKFKDIEANNLIVNNSLNSKNIDITQDIDINNNLFIANNIYLKNKQFNNFNYLTLSQSLEMNLGFTKNSNGRSIHYSNLNQPLRNYKFLLKRGNYTINTGLNVNGNELTYINSTQYIGFEVENDVSYNFIYKGHSQSGIDYYRKLTFDSIFSSDYRGNQNIENFYSGIIDIDVCGNFGYVNVSVYNAETSVFDDLPEYRYNQEYNIDKIFLYEHDINLIETLENIDISLDTLLVSNRDSLFNNVDLSNLIVKNDLTLNYLDASNILFLNNDKKIIGNNNFKFKDIDSQLITHNLLVNNNQTIINDLSVNNQVDVSGLKVFNRLDVEGNVNFDNNLQVENNALIFNNLNVNNQVDVSGLKVFNRLDTYGDVSFNSNLQIDYDVLIKHDLSVNNQLDVSGLKVFNKLEVECDSVFNSGLVNMKNDLIIEGNTRTFNRQTNGELIVNNDASFNRNVIILNDLSLNRNLKMNGILYGPPVLVIDPSTHNDNTGELRIKGNLVVEGSQTLINSSILDISDHTILLASNASTRAATEGAGIEISGNKLFTYSDLSDSWVSNIDLTVSRNAIINNNLTVENNLNVNARATIDILDVNNNLDVSNNLYVNEEAFIDGSLNVNKTFNIYSNSSSIYKKILEIDNIQDQLIITNKNTVNEQLGNIRIDGSVTINGNLDLVGGEIRSVQNADIPGGFIYNTPVGYDGTTIARERAFFTHVNANSVGVSDYFIFQEFQQPDITYYKPNLDVSHITVAEGASVGRNFIVGENITVNGTSSLNNQVDLSGTLILKTTKNHNKVLSIKNNIGITSEIETVSFLTDGTFTSVGDINLSSSNKITTINSILNANENSTFSKQVTINGILNSKDNIKLGTENNYSLLNIDSNKNLIITPFSDIGINNGNIDFKSNINVFNKLNLYNKNENANTKCEFYTEQDKLTIKPHSNSNGTVIIDGNLNVLGTQTIINSTVIELSDNIITLNANTLGMTTGGININISEGPTPNLKKLEYNKNNTRWEFDNGTSTIHASQFTGNAATVTNGIYTTSSVTALQDVTSVGSGQIITNSERNTINFLSNISNTGSGTIISTNERNKLSNIEAGADITDSTNVKNAGAVMNSGNETINGEKTFSSTIAGNINGNAASVTNGVYTNQNSQTINGTLYATDFYGNDRLSFVNYIRGYDSTSGWENYTPDKFRGLHHIAVHGWPNGARSAYIVPSGDGLAGCAAGSCNINVRNDHLHGFVAQNPSRGGQWANSLQGNYYNSGFTGTHSYRPSSDDRIKHHETIITDTLRIIRQLVPKKYKKTPGKLFPADYSGTLDDVAWHWEAGLIAQEVANIEDLSWCVRDGDYIDESGNIVEAPYTLGYNNVLMYSLKATKELDEITTDLSNNVRELNEKVTSDLSNNIRELNEKITKLQNDNSSLISRINNLENENIKLKSDFIDYTNSIVEHMNNQINILKSNLNI